MNLLSVLNHSNNNINSKYRHHSLVLVAIIREAVVLRELVLFLFEGDRVAHQELSTGSQTHEHMIIQVAIRKYVP